MADTQSCAHDHTETYVTGTRWFDGFEVMDDLKEYTVCLDCGTEIQEPHRKLTQEQWDALKVEF